MSDVRLEGIRKEFKETVAVAQLDLTINEGEFFSLLGPSGCGKTTTLRMVAGLEELTAGTIRLVPARKAPVDREGRLELYDQATERQRAREARRGPAAPATDRGWTREDLYDRGGPR